LPQIEIEMLYEVKISFDTDTEKGPKKTTEIHIFEDATPEGAIARAYENLDSSMTPITIEAVKALKVKTAYLTTETLKEQLGLK
jgi:hypothetical protein